MPDEKIHNPTVTQHLGQTQRKDCTRDCSEMGKVMASVKHMIIFQVIFGILSVLFGLWATVMIVAATSDIENLTKRVDVHRTELNDLHKHNETDHRHGHDEDWLGDKSRKN